MTKITVTTQKMVVVRKGLFKRAKFDFEPCTKEYEETYKGIQDAILQCCVHEKGGVAEVTYLNEEGETEEWSLWRLAIEYGRISEKNAIAEITNKAEYKATDAGLQKEAEKLAKEMNADFKSKFSRAVKQALGADDNSGIATFL
jgi:hypothetical protein